MYTRLSRNIIRLQRHCNALAQLQITHKVQSYATTTTTRKHLLKEQSCRQFLTQKCLSFSTKTALKTNLVTIDSLIEKLENHFQKKGYISYDLFCELLNKLQKESVDGGIIPLTKEQAQFFLNSCGTLMPTQTPQTRLELLNLFWALLKQHEQLELQHFKIYLNALQYNRGMLPDFRIFLQETSKYVDHANTDKEASIELYAELLETSCSSGNMLQAKEIMSEMRKQNIPLSERNFNSLILGHARNLDLQGLSSVLDSMKAAGIMSSSQTRTVQVIAYLENNEFAKSVKILKDYQRQFEIPQILKILRCIVHLKASYYAENLSNILEVVAQLVNELPKDFVTGSELPMGLRNVFIELLYNGKLDLVKSMLSVLPQPIFNDSQDIDSYGIFLLNEIFASKVDNFVEEALEVAKILKENNKNVYALHRVTELAIHRSPETALIFLKELAEVEPLRPHYFWPLIMYNLRQYGEQGILSTLKQMQQLKVECDQETLQTYVIPNLWVTLENLEEAMKKLDELGVRSTQVLRLLITHAISQQKYDEIINLLELYPIKLDLKELLRPIATLSVSARAMKQFQRFSLLVANLARKSNAPKNDFVGQLLFEMIAKQPRLLKDLVALQRLVNGLYKFDLKMSTAAVNSLNKILTEQHTPSNFKVENIQKTLQSMSAPHLHFSSASNTTATETQNPESSFYSANNSGNSSYIKHPRDMTLDELELHLVELESKKMNTRGVLRRILQLSVRDNRLERALVIKEKCDKLKVQVSPGMLACIFDLYIKLKNLPEAIKSLETLHKTFPGFQIDEHKLIDYAALLVHTGQLEAGKEILQKNADNNKVFGGDYVIKNIWNFLTNVAKLAASKSPPLERKQNLTRDTFVFLNNLRYCGNQNAILGPIIREYLLRGDIVAAIEEFQRLADQYKRTPLQFELLSLLVRLSNGDEEDIKRFKLENPKETAQQLLADTTNIITKVHGNVNMNSALLLAFAESGTDQQLRRLVIDPEFRINQELLLQNCEHLGDEGAVKTLLRLARCARGLSHILDEQFIYNMLLKKFAKRNNYEAALDLYETLEADDELKISQEFLRQLVSLLRVNKIEIPSNIALRAQITK